MYQRKLICQGTPNARVRTMEPITPIDPPVHTALCIERSGQPHSDAADLTRLYAGVPWDVPTQSLAPALPAASRPVKRASGIAKTLKRVASSPRRRGCPTTTPLPRPRRTALVPRPDEPT